MVEGRFYSLAIMVCECSLLRYYLLGGSTHRFFWSIALTGKGFQAANTWRWIYSHFARISPGGTPSKISRTRRAGQIYGNFSHLLKICKR